MNFAAFDNTYEAFNIICNIFNTMLLIILKTCSIPKKESIKLSLWQRKGSKKSFLGFDIFNFFW